MNQNKIILLVVSVLAVAGLGYGVYKYSQTDNDQDLNTSSETQSNSSNTSDQSQGASGDQTVEGRLVDGFPGSKIPLYLGDVVESKRSTDSQGRTEYNVSIQTSDDMQKVGDRLETSYMNEGWEIKTKLTDSMFVSHSDEFITTVSYSENDSGVLINYGITTK